MTNPDPTSNEPGAEDIDDAGPACVMVFNASDPSGAGGLAADITAIASVGAHALPVVTGAYARDTAEVLDSGPTVASRTVMVVGKLVILAARRLKAEVEARSNGVPFHEAFREDAREHGATRIDQQFEPYPGVVFDDATYLGDAARSRRLYGMLLPYDGLNVTAGRAAASYGPVARVLALLAATDGRLDDAERHFADALAMSDRMGDRPFAARTRYELARMLLERDRGRDRERALELLATVLDSAQEIGMVRLVQEALAARSKR